MRKETLLNMGETIGMTGAPVNGIRSDRAAEYLSLWLLDSRGEVWGAKDKVSAIACVNHIRLDVPCHRYNHRIVNQSSPDASFVGFRNNTQCLLRWKRNPGNIW